MWSVMRNAFGPDIPLPDTRCLPKRDSGVLAWMLFFLRPHFFVLGLTILIRITRFTAMALVPFFFGLLIQTLESGTAFGDQEALWHHILWIAAFYFVVLGSYQVLVFESFAMDKATRGLTLFSIGHLLALPLDWHEQQGSGAKLQRVMQARENLREIYFLFARNFLPFIGAAIAVIITIVAMKVPMVIMWLFAGYAVSYLAVAFSMTLMQDRLQEKHNTLKENLVSRVYDFVTLVRLAKTFVLADYVARRSHEGEQAGHNVIRRLRYFSYLKWSLMNLVVWIFVGAILWVGMNMTLDKQISIGAFSAVIFMAHRLWNTLEEVAIMQLDYIEYKNGFLRIRETLGVTPQNYDVAPVIKTPAWRQITCDDLSFTYGERGHALSRIHLVIPRGKKIALVGHSGAGKSTFIKVLMKQLMPTSGAILVGDSDLRHIDSRDWLAHMALVPQDVELMNATLRENIILDHAAMSEDVYKESLRKAYLSDFVAGLPQQDQTEIGERGVKLSGGQRQRLGIARALARQAEIIIFDEATSSLDSESEAHIQRAMREAFADKTLIVIAHRLSTIRDADIIYVFENGTIVESGNFAELEKNSRIFSKLWAMQSGGFIA